MFKNTRITLSPANRGFIPFAPPPPPRSKENICLSAASGDYALISISIG
jgi:hypothetical protein